MTTLTYKQIREMIDDNQNPSAQVVWNSAIEAAASSAIEGGSNDVVANEIRKLKVND